jgi:hypothetical protein
MTMEGPKLTPEQAAEVRAELAPGGVPVRFLFHGQCLDIQTGALQSKGINVIHQNHYWGFSRETSNKVVKFLGNDVRAEFSS